MNVNLEQLAATTVGNRRNFAIKTEHLTKTYGSSRGVTDLTLEIYEGEIFGFLGPNGAGKTTTIRMLLNLIAPTTGKASIFGLDTQKDSVAIKKDIGYLPGEFTLYPNLTGAATLEYFSHLRGLNLKETWRYVEELAQRLDLDLSKKFRQYSRGNKQKLGIVQALLHRPKLLILDEPTGGLDPLNQQEFYKLVEEIRAAGATIFFSSHILSEVEKCCDRVGIIREGELIRVGTLAELTNLKNHELELVFAGSNAPVEKMQSLPGVEKVEVEARGENTVLRCVAKNEVLSEIIKIAAGYSVLNFTSREPSLEETFLDYYKK